MIQLTQNIWKFCTRILEVQMQIFPCVHGIAKKMWYIVIVTSLNAGIDNRLFLTCSKQKKSMVAFAPSYIVENV